MRFKTCILLMLLATAASGQGDFSFSPRSADPKGGAEIQIVSNDSVVFTAPQVFFGEAASPHVTLVDVHTIKALAPAHAVGIVPITILDNSVLLHATVDFAFAPALEEILIPIALQPTDASYGTRWVSEISVYNDSDDVVPIDEEVCFFIGRPVDCGLGVRRIPAHSSMRIEPRYVAFGYPAMLLWPPAEQAARLHFTVRLYETSRDPDGAGIEIPVVRSHDFQQAQVSLPSVPTAARFRSTLRVLSRETDIFVRVKDITTGELLAESEIRRIVPSDIDPFGTMILNDLLSPANIRSRDKVRIEVAVSPAAAAYNPFPVWALLTLTDNDTQRVQIFTPQ